MARGPLGNVIRLLRRAVGPADGAATDRQLLARFAEQRDEAAFAQLVERHGPMVWSACRRVLGDGPDTEDAFQAAFVVLAQKAGASGWQESASSWLYEVAYRVALRARRDSIRRRQRESEAAAMIPERSQPDAEHADLRALLDAELTCLPEKYRAPVVLCYLQGQTNDEVARLLGWTRGTVASRLSRARDLLRERLTRRGLALPAAVLTVSLSENAAPAAVPGALVDTTVKAVSLLPTAQALAAGALSAPAASLAEGVLQAMFVKQMKWAALTVLALAVFGISSGVVAYRSFFVPPSLALAVPLEVQPPVGPPMPVASEPAVKSGLAVTVLPLKAIFGKDESPGMEFTFANQSPEAFQLASMNYFPERMREAVADDLKSGVRWIGHYTSMGRNASPAPVSAQVPAGASVKNGLVLGKTAWESWSWQIQGEKRAARQLPPGKYRLSFRIQWDAGQRAEKPNYWTGEITTNPVEIEIVDREQAQPTVKEGLAVAVATRRDYYPVGTAPEMVVALKNTTNKILTLHHPAHAVRIWNYAFTDLKNGSRWEARFPAGLNTLPPAVLQPGEVYTMPVNFNGGQFRTGDDTPARSVAELPPGQYRLHMTVRLENFPVTPNEIIWSGEVQASPVEFVMLKP